MNFYYDIAAVAFGLAVNLLMFGTLAAIGVAISFRLVCAAAPRARYLVAVLAFSIAAFVPTALTLRDIFKSQTAPTALIETARPNSNGIAFSEEQTATSQIETAMKATNAPLSESLNNFVSSVGRSGFGIGFLFLWMLVSFLLLIREISGHLRLRRNKKTWQAASAAERLELACPPHISLYFDEYESPCTVGLLRPVIVLPGRLPDDLSPDAVRSVVRHEINHALWRDPLFNSFLRFVRAALWISPAIWFLERVACNERESAADCAALDSSSASIREIDAAEYATTLVRMAELSNRFAARNSGANIAATSFRSGHRLENRVRRLLVGYAKPGPARIILAAFAIAISFGGMALLPAASQPLKVAQKQTFEDETKAEKQPNDESSIEEHNRIGLLNENDKDDVADKVTNNASGITGDSKNQNENSGTNFYSGKVLVEPTPPILVDKRATTNSASQDEKTNEIVVADNDYQDSSQTNIVITPVSRVDVQLREVNKFVYKNGNKIMSEEEIKKVAAQSLESLKPYLPEIKRRAAEQSQRQMREAGFAPVQ